MRPAVARWWRAFADALGGFFDEAAFRIVLAYDVIVGRLPHEVERRHWHRSLEAPVLVDVLDWTDERRIFSVLVWPPLESAVRTASHNHRERVEQVKAVIARGAADMAYSTRFETDYGLQWDRKREVWTSSAGDGFAYDGSDTRDALEGGRDAT